MMKRRLIVAASAVVLLVAGLAFVLWPKPPEVPAPTVEAERPRPRVEPRVREDVDDLDEPEDVNEDDDGGDRAEALDWPVPETETGAQLTGSVVTSSGNPAGGADVRFETTRWHSAVSAIADAAGKFTLTVEPKAKGVLSARWHDEEGERLYELENPPAPVVITTSVAGSLLVKVVGPSHDPAPGFEVTVVSHSQVSEVMQADDKGQALFAALKPGRYAVSVMRHNHNYAGEGTVVGHERATVEIKVSEDLELTGVVRTAKGPVPGAGLDIEDLAPDAGRFSSSFATTNEDGTFAAAVHRGHFLVRVTHHDGTASVKADVPGPPLTITLGAPAKLSGLVLDAKGAPVPDFEVWLLSNGQESMGRNRTRSLADGSFTLDQLTPGDFTATGSGHEHGDARAFSQPVHLEAGQTTKITVRLDGSGNRFAGRVLDEKHQPLPKSQLNLNWENGGHSYLQTGADGTFAFEHIPAEKISVAANTDGYASFYSMEVKVPDEHYEIVLARPGGITGHVVDAGGRPVTRFAINGKVITSEDGSFKLPLSSLGTQALVLEARGAGLSAWAFDVQSGKETDLGNLSAVPRPKVKVRLHFSGGRVGALLLVGAASGKGSVISIPFPVLDADAEKHGMNSMPGMVGFDAANEAEVIAPATEGFTLMVVGGPKPKSVPLVPGTSVIDVTPE